MLAALALAEMIKKLGELTPSKLTEFYKLTYQEAYKEGQKDAQIACGCQEED